MSDPNDPIQGGTQPGVDPPIGHPENEKKKDCILEKNCIVCSKPLSTLEEFNGYHFDCRTCEHCRHAITVETMNEWIKGRKARAHSQCEEKYQLALYEDRPITITQRELDYLNLCRTMVEGDVTGSIEDNQSKAERAVKDLHNLIEKRNGSNHQRTIEECFLTLKKMQSISAVMSILIKGNADQFNLIIRREALDIRRKTEDAEKIAQAQEYRETQHVEKLKKREKGTLESKAIKALMKSGLTEKMARAKLDEMKLSEKLESKNNGETAP